MGDVLSARRSSRRLAARTALWLAAFLPSGLRAQTPPVAVPGDRVSADLKDFEIREENGSRVFLFHRGVEIVRGEIFLKADSLVGWVHPPPPPEPGKAAPPPPPSGAAPGGLPDAFDEVYAEGHVLFRTGTREVQCGQLYYDFRISKGIVTNFELESRNPRSGGSLFLKGAKGQIWFQAHEVREFSRLHLEAENCTITGCSFPHPHYVLRAGQASYDSGMDWFELRQVDTRFFGIPVFYWPFSIGMNTDRRPFFRSLELQRSRRFGFSTYATFGLQLFLQEQPERLDPAEDPIPQKLKEWGDLRTQIDYRQKRGTAYGADLDYQWDSYSGHMTAYYLKDRGPDPLVQYERQFLPLEDDNRFRFRSFHRQDFLEHWRAELETSYISDRHFLQEFFDREFKESKEQENTAYLRFLRDNKGGTLRGRLRLNDFQNQVEYLPQLKTYVYSEPLFPSYLANVYLTNVSEMSNVRRRLDEKLLPPPEPEVWRLDSDTTLQVPLGLGPVQVLPLAGARFSLFERGATEDNPVGRFVGYAGVRGSTEWSAEYDVDWDLVGLHGLRHSTSLEGWWTTNFAATASPEDLKRFDDVEEVSRFREVAIEWNHRFETHVRGAGEESTLEFLSLGAGIEYYPDAARDTTRLRQSNVLIPFHWIPLVPAAKGVFRERDWSNLYWNVRLTPKSFFDIESTGEFNPETRLNEATRTYLSLRPAPWCSLSVYDQYLRDITNALGYYAQVDLGDRWSVSAAKAWDLRLQREIYSAYTVTRDLHDFELGLTVEFDKGQDDIRYGIALTPKFARGRTTSSVLGATNQTRTDQARERAGR